MAAKLLEKRFGIKDVSCGDSKKYGDHRFFLSGKAMAENKRL